MLLNATMQKLHEMRLGAMASALRQQIEDHNCNDMSFEDRFGMIVDSEWSTRKSNRVKRLIRNADFHFPGACLEDVDYHADRELDRATMMRLSTCNYIQDYRNIIILGATGSGKTWLSNAFGVAACRNYYTVRYTRLPDLLIELEMARAEGTYHRRMEQYRKVGLLILDEWLLHPLKSTDVHDILEIVDRRCHSASTIFCSQFGIGGWHERLGEATMADAICDRIAHNSYTIVVKGKESMRKRKGIQNET